jgi:hypothetical protein
VSSSANAAPNRQSAIGIVHIDAMGLIPTSPHEHSRPELPLRVDSGRLPRTQVVRKLCELYGIELETHYRALCDARATGHLLNLMNLKRESREPDRADEAA